MVDRARRDRDPASQSLAMNRQALPEVIEVAPLAAGMVNTVVAEIPFRFRTSAAFQVYAIDGGSVTATLVVEGALLDDTQRWVEASGATAGHYEFTRASVDSDYNATALLTFTNEKTIKQITLGQRYGRLRVRLTALTGTNVGLRIL